MMTLTKPNFEHFTNSAVLVLMWYDNMCTECANIAYIYWEVCIFECIMWSVLEILIYNLIFQFEKGAKFVPFFH